MSYQTSEIRYHKNRIAEIDTFMDNYEGDDEKLIKQYLDRLEYHCGELNKIYNCTANSN